MTALQLLEWKWPEAYKDIPKEIVDECFQHENEIIQNAWNNGFQCSERCNSSGEYYDKLRRMPHELNKSE